MSQKDGGTIIRMVGISKRFGGVKALDNVDLTLYHGETLCLLGDNGAGKSTLIKILSGTLSKEAGDIYYKGKKVHISSPWDARHLGIETIYQDLALVDQMDFPKNIFLGREIMFSGLLGKIGIMDVRKMITEGLKLVKTFGIKLSNYKQTVASLSGGQRQIVALSRALYFNAEVIIMDEPTAALGVAETAKVFKFIENLKKQEISIIMISHNINQVFNIADRCMVLKTGKLVGVKRKEDTNQNEIVQMIISGNSN